MPVRSLKQIQEFEYVIKTSNMTHTNDSNLLSQENQDYDIQHDQQLMTHKHDGGQRHHNQNDPQSIARKNNSGVERFNTEFEPNSVFKKKAEWFYQWAENYDVWNNNSYTPTKGNKMGGSHTFNGDTSVFNLTSTGRLKPIIKLFDSGRNYILDLSFKLNSLLVI